MGTFEKDFRESLIRHGVAAEQADYFCLEISRAYSHKKRAYHTLSHLESLRAELEGIRNDVTHWDCMIFAIAYHDVIYQATAKDNEEQSAAFAAERLCKTGLTIGERSLCNEMILATKGHSASAEKDVNYFTDADLSILGKSPEVYKNYTLAIRKEYSIFPDILYKPGRRKVVEHFLAMPKIFKTGYFTTHYEQSARNNLRQELMLL